MNELTGWLHRLTAGRDRAVVVGAAVTAAWLLLVALFWLFGPEGAPLSGLARLLSLAGVLLPVALIWLAVALAGATAELKRESVLLRAQLDLMRGAPGDGGGDSAQTARAAMPPGRDPGAALPPRTPSAAATPRPARAQPETRQGDLPFEQPAPVAVPPAELIAALNFPDGPDDHRAIAALRASLADPEAARTIRAAQDVVTLLAQHGIYADDLDRAALSAPLWRRFLEGERGSALSSLASGDDIAAEIAAGLMRTDEVFRDAAHHFLRQYDRTLTRIAAELSDEALVALSDTRSGRGFALLAQVTGMFG